MEKEIGLGHSERVFSFYPSIFEVGKRNGQLFRLDSFMDSTWNCTSNDIQSFFIEKLDKNSELS